MRNEVSAGGVVFKRDKNRIHILVAKNSNHHSWVFPKGLIGDHVENEGKKETAIREVKEETGIEAKILKELTPINYYYFWENEKVKKRVYYFIMEAIGGDITKHDHEMDEVEWINQDEVEERLTYPSDKKVWQEARKMLK